MVNTDAKWISLTENEVATLKEAMFSVIPEDYVDEFDKFVTVYAKLLEVEREFEYDRIKRNETQEI